jgi:predicted nucleic acid-binding protein
VVARAVVLDTGPLGLASNPRGSAESRECNRWLEAILQDGGLVYVPEIADYEVRRELLRAGKAESVLALDGFNDRMIYLPLTTAAMRQAAVFWATARNERRQTADDKALDGDVILAAQAATLRVPGVVIATTNVGHLGRFAPAAVWREIAVGG